VDDDRRNQIAQIASRLISRSRQATIPIDLRALEPMLRVVRIEYSLQHASSDSSMLRRLARRMHLNLEAAIAWLRKQCGLWLSAERHLYLNTEVHPVIRRWTHAHELGHALLNHEGDWQYTEAEWNSMPIPTLVFGVREDEEREADCCASELLFPSQYWSEIVKTGCFSQPLVRRITQAFHVSQHAAVRELVYRSVVPCFLVAIPRRSTTSERAYPEPYILLSPSWTAQYGYQGSELLAQVLALQQVDALGMKSSLLSVGNRGTVALTLTRTYSRFYCFVTCGAAS
jgi:hypothetical protein